MRRLLAVAAVAAAFVTPSTAQAVEFGRDCGGVLDIDCQGTVCPMDCFSVRCLVWIDPLHSPFTAVCVSQILGEA